MRRTQRIPRSVAVALTALLAVPVGSPTPLTAADWTPKAPPSIYPNAGANAERRNDYITDVCTSDSQLDCVESIGAYLDGTWVEGTPGEVTWNISRTWTIPGVVNLNGSTTVSVTHWIAYVGTPYLKTQIAAAAVPGRGNSDRDDNSLPRGVPFRATIRTSWVLPSHISGKTTDTTIKVERLPVSGASRVTLEGVPVTNMIVTDRSTLTSPTGRGDYEARSLNMTISDGRYSYLLRACIDKPPVMTAENGYGHQVPQFINGNLDLKVESPHFRSDGVTPHIGIYEALIPLETARCLWGESAINASLFTVEVIEENGTIKSATTSINIVNDNVVIKASGFTFSTPTIRVKYATSGAMERPQKPSGVRASAGKGTATVSFKRVKGLTYSAVAVQGKSKKTLKCSLNAAQVTCKASKLAKGRWKITVTPRNGSTQGTAYSKTLSVR